MYFSAKEFLDYLNRPQTNVCHKTTILLHNGILRSDYHLGGTYHHQVRANLPTLTLKHVRNYLRHMKKKVVERDYEDGRAKWHRPWEVVTELSKWQAPEGDYGIGIEVEYGFASTEAAQYIANKVKNWKYITLDFEGGRFPIEATFPPIAYTKFSSKCQAYRYLKLLQSMPDLLSSHTPTQGVGTHVNVSKGGITSYTTEHYLVRIRTINNILLHEVTVSEKRKYFGREPYGYLYNRSKFIEMKLFNSVADPKRLMQYVNIAVSIMELLTSSRELSATSVREALERGYAGRIR